MPHRNETQLAEPANSWREFLWLRYLPMAAVIVGIYLFESAWLSMLLYHAGLIAGIIPQRKRLAQLNWGSSPVAPLILLVMGLIAGPLVYFGLPLLTSETVGEEMTSRLAALGLEGKSLYVFVTYFVLIHPALEELGWRGVLFFKGGQLHYTDFEFAAYHLLVIYWLFPGDWLLLVVTFLVLTVSAWSWRQLRDRVGFKGVIAFHAASDFAILVAVGKLAGLPPFN